MRLWMKLGLGVSGLLLLWVSAIGTARALGGLLPVSPTYLGSGDCPLPCWQGLMPGEDNINQFMHTVENNSPFRGRTRDRGDNVAIMFELYPFGAISLGDLVRELGPPQRVGCLGLGHSALYPGQRGVMEATVYYADGLVVVNAVLAGDARRLSPQMAVRSVQYHAPGEPLYAIGSTRDWQGFAAAPHYAICNR